MTFLDCSEIKLHRPPGGREWNYCGNGVFGQEGNIVTSGAGLGKWCLRSTACLAGINVVLS